MLVLLAMLPLAAVSSALHIGRMQSTAVKGVLMCNNQPAANVKVKLYDDDIGRFHSTPLTMFICVTEGSLTANAERQQNINENMLKMLTQYAL